MTDVKKMIAIGAVVALAAAAVPVLGQVAQPTTKDVRQGDPYLLDVCPVSKEKLGSMGDPVVMIHEGREVRFCCRGCVKEFAADPSAVFKAADEIIVERQRPYYPVEVCVVSNEPLEKPVDVVYMNRLVRLCCKGCKKEFGGDPKAFLTKLDTLIVAKQREHYPLTVCPVSQEELESEAVEVVYGNRFMRFCCKRCVRSFEKNPTAHVAALDKAWAAKHGMGGEHGARGHDKHGLGEHGRAGGGDGS